MELIPKKIKRPAIIINPTPIKILRGIFFGRLKISFPPMTEELRQKIVKLVAEKTEKTTQTVRHWRKEARKKIDDAFTEGELSEDNKFKAREKLDELISEYNEKIDEMSERKKKEVME